MITKSTCSTSLVLLGFATTLLSLSLSQHTGASVEAATTHTHELPRWGTFRPNIYFGLKARVPTSPLVGVMWHDANPMKPRHGRSMSSGLEIRHDAAEHDKMRRFGWLRHNGRNFGVHEVLDRRLQMNLTTVYRHVHTSKTGRERLVTRIRAEPLAREWGGKPERARNVSFVWYVALPSSEDSLKLLSSADNTGTSETVRLEVNSREPVGKFTVEVRPAQHTPLRFYEPTVQKPQFLGVRREAGQEWDTKEAYDNAAKGNMQRKLRGIEQDITKQHERMPHTTDVQERQIRQNRLKAEMMRRVEMVQPRLVNAMHKQSNVVMLQYMVSLPFELELVLQEQEQEQQEQQEQEQEQEQQQEHDVEMLLRDAEAEAEFEERFESTFKLARKGYVQGKVQFAKAALSNLLGGIGHFHGKAIVQMPEDKEPRETEREHELLSGCPSRSFFPRGFMWDEGFHQLLVSCWDTELSSRVLRSWAEQVDPTGWLPREQILGAEARSRVPEKFQAQRPSVANPPTLLLAVESLLERAEKKADLMSVQELRSFLDIVYPAFLRQARWYMRTQQSATQGKYRWADRTPDHCLSSGLDDYPRGEYVFPQEAHVDLHAWLIMVCQTVSRMAQWLLDHPADGQAGAGAGAGIGTPAELQAVVSELTEQASALLGSLDDFWSARSNSYQDLRYNNVTSQLEPVEHDGYVSLFPFLMGLVPGDSPRITHILKQMSNPKGLFSDWGLRSLSPQDRLFQSQEQYWRGPIWININYLAVRALHKYAKAPAGSALHGPHASEALKLYKSLRKNLINNLYKNYKRTGYLWEQYSAKNGKGQRSHPFTGWTALVLLIMSERY